MKNFIPKIPFLLLLFHCSWLVVFAQPSVEKVEPSSWMIGSRMKNIRVMLTGKNLGWNKMVIVSDSPDLIASNWKWSQNKELISFDLRISPNIKPGKYKFTIQGIVLSDSTNFYFEILPKSEITSNEPYKPGIEIEKVEPSSWRIGSNLNPYRVRLTGRNLRFNKRIIKADNPNISVINIKDSEDGKYLFLDLKISPKTKPGKYKIVIFGAAPQSASFEFEILPKAAEPNLL